MSIFFWLLIGSVVLPYITGPVAVYFLHRSPKRREFFSLTSEEVASTTSKGYAKRLVGMSQLGFESVAHLQSIHGTTSIYASIFHNMVTLERAMVAEITVKPPIGSAPSVKSSYLEFMSEFANGSEVLTNNSATPRVLPELAEKKVRSFPTFEHAADVYAIHRHFTADLPGELRQLPEGEMIRIDLETEVERTFRRQCDTGYFWFDEGQRAYRPTVRGAFIMSWKLLWPVGTIRKWVVRCESKRMGRLVAARA